jgi:hypothetical protein
MTTYSVEQVRCHLRTLTGALLLAACGDSSPPVEPPPTDVACNGVSTAVRAPAVLESVVLSGASIACFALAGGDRQYLVIPQLTAASLPYGGYGFRLGDPNASPVVSSVQPVPEVIDTRPALQVLQEFGGGETNRDAQSRLDAQLRRQEAVWAATPRRHADLPSLSVHGTASEEPLLLRRFSVLNTLDEPPAFSAVGARLRFSGARVLVYVDTLAETVFAEAEVRALGALYDQTLVGAVTSAFGDGSDIDGNGRVIVLLTPTVNSMVSAARCASSGFVRGFFYNNDLGGTTATSNRGEVIYGFVPDETGRWSCPHTKTEVLSNLAPTFMHELQHMISFGEHAIERGGTTEEAWLNEGLSHMAEEIGSLVYETRFPAPSGRAQPSQLFPDSAAPFITPNVLYSYRYLFSSAIYSLTNCAPGTFCSLAERGGVWLYLRWLADQQGDALFRKLVETRLTGRANIEAAMGRPTASLLGDFAMAVSADSLVGMPKMSAPVPLRFASRNLRRVYKGLFDAVGLIGGVGRPFPIEPLPLTPGVSVTGTMRPGTFLTYRIRVGSGTSSATLRFVSSDGTPFPLTSGAQVSVLRLP